MNWPRVKELDPRPARGSWAPGNYLGTCPNCGCRYVGDKRAQQCADCAYIEKRSKIYLIGSLKHPVVPTVAWELREQGFDVFDDWHACGPEADMHWRNYEIERGRTYQEALQAPFVRHSFEFDKKHIDESDVGVLVMPAGKSGHLELGYMIGQGKVGYILLDKEPEGWDMMYLFAHGIFYDINQLTAELKRWAQSTGRSPTW